MRYDMIDADKIMAGIVALAVVAVCAGALMGAQFRSQAPPAVHASFKVGDCFVQAGHRERWRPAADGMVMDVGRASYLVVYAVSLRSTYVDVPKEGHERSIELFEREYTKAECPGRW